MSAHLYKTDQTADERINRNEDGEDIMQDGGYQVIVQEKGHFSDNRTEQGCLYKRKKKKRIFIQFSLSKPKLSNLRHIL